VVFKLLGRPAGGRIVRGAPGPVPERSPDPHQARGPVPCRSRIRTGIPTAEIRAGTRAVNPSDTQPFRAGTPPQ